MSATNCKKDAYSYHVCGLWYMSSYTIASKPIKTQDVQYAIGSFYEIFYQTVFSFLFEAFCSYRVTHLLSKGLVQFYCRNDALLQNVLYFRGKLQLSIFYKEIVHYRLQIISSGFLR